MAEVDPRHSAVDQEDVLHQNRGFQRRSFVGSIGFGELLIRTLHHQNQGLCRHVLISGLSPMQQPVKPERMGGCFSQPD